MKPKNALSQHLAKIGAKGGKTTGSTKARKRADMQRAAKIGWAKRRAKLRKAA